MASEDTILPTTWLGSRPWFRDWLQREGSVQHLATEVIDEADWEILQGIDVAAQG